MPHTAPTIYRKHRSNQELLGKTGTVVSYTNIFAAPKGQASRSPYILAIIELDENKTRMPLQLTQAKNDTIAIGSRVSLVLRKEEESTDGLIAYGVKGALL